jgi:hypothetical protein
MNLCFEVERSLFMTGKFKSVFAIFAVCGLLASTAATARAQFSASQGSLCGCTGEIHEIEAGIVAGAAVITVMAILAVRHHNSVAGCTVSSPSGIYLQTDSGRDMVLLGATAGIKAGERIKISGSRKKKVEGITDRESFVISKVTKDYGSCTPAPVTP